MNIAELDLQSLEFMKLMKAGDFGGAHAALTALVSDRSICPNSHAKWRAVIFERSGDHQSAADALSPVIEQDGLDAKFATHHRARIRLDAGMHDEALVDLYTLLADETPRVAGALHQSCRFQAAYILAQRGDPTFRDLFDQIPDGSECFIVNSILNKSDLENLYQANQKRSRQRLDRKTKTR